MIRPARLMSAALLVVAVAASTLVAVAPASAAIGAEIHGKVQGEGTPNVNLANYTLYAYSTAGGAASAMTNASGDYAFTGLAAGSYRIFFPAVAAQNYQQEYWDNQTNFANSTYITLAANEVVTGKNAVLSHGATISGTVKNGSNVGLAGVIVTARNLAGDGWAATTDSTGAYSIPSVPAGSWTLEFRSSTYATEFWNDALTKGAATYFTVADGATVTGMDAVLALGSTISGHVESLGTPNTSLSGATVTAYLDGEALGDANTVNGDYTLRGLAAGSYTLRFDGPYGESLVPEYWNNQRHAASADAVVVPAATAVTAKDAVLDFGGSISGVVLDEFDESVPSVAVLYRVGADDNSTTLFDMVAVNGAGQYAFDNVPLGSYRVGFTADLAGVNGIGGLSTSSDYASVWYGDVYDYSLATTIALDTAGQAFTGADGTLLYPAFADVSDPSSSVYTYIQWMYTSGISTGTPQPSGKPLYKPSASVSRQAMASFLYKLSGATFTAPVEPSFADVDSSSQFYTAIEWMASESISTGTPQPSGKPLFKATDPVSRQAMALFLARYAGADLSVTPTAQSFADVPVSSGPAAAIAWMKDSGISVGTAQQGGLPLYKPADPVSRSAMATFLYRLAHLP